MKIAIDLDGTIRPMVEGYIKYINGFGLYEGLSVADIYWDHPIFELELFNKYFQDEKEMMKIEPYKYCKNVLNLWREMGHEIIILTSTFQPEESVKRWLEAHEINYNELIITKKKGEHEFDLLIEDKETVPNEVPKDRAIIFIAQPWNKELPRQYYNYRLDDWLTVLYCFMDSYLW